MDGYKALAAAIIGQSIIDHQEGTKSTVKECDDFYNSEWFRDLCVFLDIPAERALDKIHTSDITVPDELF